MALAISNDACRPPNSGRRLRFAGAAAILGKILQITTAAFIGFSLPLCLTVSDVGIFFLAQAAVTFGANVMQLGFHHTLPFTVGRCLAEGDAGRARSVVTIAFSLCLIAGLVIGCVLVIIAYVAPQSLGTTLNELGRLAPLLIPMIIITALITLIAELQRSVFSVIAASFLPLVQNTGVSIAIAAALLLSLRPSVGQLLEISLAILALALVWGVLETWRTVSRWTAVARVAIRTPELLRATWPNLVVVVGFAAAAQLDIWIVSLYAEATDVAFYGIALRISSLLAIPITVASLTVIPHIVTNWTLRRRRYLQWLLSLSATGATFVVAMGIVVFIIIGKDAIRLVFGDRYVAAFLPALILSVGQVLFAAGGAAGYILIILGKQKLAMMTTLVTGVVTVLVAIPAMQLFGIVGVASVYAASAAIQALTNTLLVNKLFGLRSYAPLINPARVLKIFSHRPRS